MRLGESFFCICYLIFLPVMGFILLRETFHDAKFVNLTDDFYRMAAFATFTLMLGDAFHLIPRVVSNIRGEGKKDEFFLGLGNLISSITMTVFYVLLYFAVYYASYPFYLDGVQDSLTSFYGLFRILIICLAVVRVALCCFPQNNWFRKEGNDKWSMIRNAPFLLLGLVMIVFLVLVYTKNANGELPLSFIPGSRYFFMAVLIFLSFAFYIPVILWGRKKPSLGMFMIPKTICYIILICLFH